MGIEYRIVQRAGVHHRQPGARRGAIGRRLADFQERAGYYYGNWDRLYGEWQTADRGAHRRDRGGRGARCWATSTTLEVITGGRGFASNHFLRENFHRCIDLYSKMWHHHTEFLMLGYGAYVVFFEFCKQAFPEMGDQMVARHGRRHGRHHVPPGRRAEEARRAGRRARPRRPVRRGRGAGQGARRARRARGAPAPAGWPRSRRRRTRGSTSRSATASTTTTCPGPTT